MNLETKKNNLVSIESKDIMIKSSVHQLKHNIAAIYTIKGVDPNVRKLFIRENTLLLSALLNSNEVDRLFKTNVFKECVKLFYEKADINCYAKKFIEMLLNKRPYETEHLKPYDDEALVDIIIKYGNQIKIPYDGNISKSLIADQHLNDIINYAGNIVAQHNFNLAVKYPKIYNVWLELIKNNYDQSIPEHMLNQVSRYKVRSFRLKSEFYNIDNFINTLVDDFDKNIGEIEETIDRFSVLINLKADFTYDLEGPLVGLNDLLCIDLENKKCMELDKIIFKGSQKTICRGFFDGEEALSFAYEAEDDLYARCMSLRDAALLSTPQLYDLLDSEEFYSETEGFITPGSVEKLKSLMKEYRQTDFKNNYNTAKTNPFFLDDEPKSFKIIEILYSPMIQYKND